MDIPGWYQRFSTSHWWQHQGLPNRLVCPSLLLNCDLIYLQVCYKRIDKLIQTWFDIYTQNTARYKASRWRNTMVWFAHPSGFASLWQLWHDLAALSRFSGPFFSRWTALDRRGAHFKGLVSWDVCIKHRGDNLQRIRGYIGLLIQFTCIVLKSYFIGLLSLHGCIIWCQLNQCFPEFVNVGRPSDLEARQSEPLRHCRRRRFWLEGCSHPICLVA